MRVRLLAPFRLLWDYAVHDLEKDAEFTGDLARHLNATGAPVEVLEHDPEPEPTPPADPAQQPAATPEPGQQPPDGLDIAGTIDTILTWVGEDPTRARAALDAELAKGDAARTTLTGHLQTLLGTAP